MTTAANPLEQFQWEPQPRAQSLVTELVEGFLSRCPGARDLADRMRSETATRFADWVDAIEAPMSTELIDRLVDTGFELQPVPGAAECYEHLGAMFPRVVLHEGDDAFLKPGVTRLGIKVDSVDDFLFTWRIDDSEPVEGEPLASMRRARAFTGDKAEMWVIERHGYRGFVAPEVDPDVALKRLAHREAFRRRQRDFATDREGMEHVHALVDAAMADLGADLACDLFFAAERDYWQSRNRAARVQKARQDSLGLGWANHDHHTYRLSRENFPTVIALFEKLGFHPRERFYAGSQAGWGAQVLEQPGTGIIIFADVDMTPEEVQGDFAHEGFAEGKKLGAVGLWVALHGEAILQAGMHHLECQFDHAALVEQLEKTADIRTMDPFTSFPHLRQAFTEGERWPVDPKRIERLRQSGHLSDEQAQTIRQEGAVGSHLENLERNDGYKGFNQEGVSDIIDRTHPTRLVSADA